MTPSTSVSAATPFQGSRRDPWLERWLPLIELRADQKPVLELGCGAGDDTETLTDAGHEVVAVDLSAEAIDRLRHRLPQVRACRQDIQDDFPVYREGTSVIVASLSLHYFGWNETCMLVERIRQTLSPPGLFLCRLNSTRDEHYGASGHPQIEDNYYLVDGLPKRFFDRSAILRLFAGRWRIIALEEYATNKYPHPKMLWEVVLETVD